MHEQHGSTDTLFQQLASLGSSKQAESVCCAGLGARVPPEIASLRNLAIGLLRLAGATTNVAAAARFFMRHAERAMEVLGVPSAVPA